MKLPVVCIRGLALEALLLVPAYATDVTYSTSTSPIAVGGSVVVTLPRFDPALGVLRNATVTGSSSVSGTWSVENLSASPNTFGGYGSGTYVVAFVLMTVPSAFLSPMNPAYLIDPLTLPAFDGTVDYGGTSGVVLAFANEVGDGGPSQQAHIFGDNALATYVGTGSVSFTVGLPQNAVPNMPQNFQTSVSISTNTIVEVRYGYESFPTRICRGLSSASPACPCGNSSLTSSGCGNSSNANGGALDVSGTSSITADTLVLSGSGMPNGGALYFEGTSYGYIQTAFGDGLLCVGGGIVRLGVKFNAAGASQYPMAGDASIAASTGIAALGVRAYQVWYRDAANYCTSATFNVTNGQAVQWVP